MIKVFVVARYTNGNQFTDLTGPQKCIYPIDDDQEDEIRIKKFSYSEKDVKSFTPKEVTISLIWGKRK